MLLENLMPVVCKKCSSDDVMKCGHIRGKQRFRCKHCGYTFVLGDGRTTEEITLKKAVLLLLHVVAGATFHQLGRLFHLCPSQVFRWICKSGFHYPKQDMYGELIQVMPGDLSSIVESKANQFDRSKPVLMARGELVPGYQAIILLQTPTSGTEERQANPFHSYRIMPYAKH